MLTAKWFLIWAAFNGFAAVALGAFGAHGLKGKLSQPLLSAYETAVQYHFYHVLALLFVALLINIRRPDSVLLTLSAWGFAVGIVLFSGSLYGLALGGPRWLGPVTPVGGLCFLAGWFMLFIGVLKA